MHRGIELSPAHSPVVQRIDAAVGDAEAAELLGGKEPGRIPWVWVTAREAFLAEAARLGLAETTVAEAGAKAFDP